MQIKTSNAASFLAVLEVFLLKRLHSYESVACTCSSCKGSKIRILVPLPGELCTLIEPP